MHNTNSGSRFLNIPSVPMGEIRAGGGKGHNMKKPATVGSSSMMGAKPMKTGMAKQSHGSAGKCSSCG
jgi:hypothetical protein